MKKNLKRLLSHLKFPAICSLCNQYHTKSSSVCSDCLDCFTLLGPACRFCALPLPDDSFLVCGTCTQKKPSFDTVFVRYRFEEPLRTLLHQLKYRESLYLIPLIAQLMLMEVPVPIQNTNCFIPVPMHPKRLRQRGFNHAGELTKYLATRLKRPYALFDCKKIRHTQAQAVLSRKERIQNLKGAFHSNLKMYQRVTIVDDLLTTGSTANELVDTLKKQGISEVNVWCAARALL